MGETKIQVPAEYNIETVDRIDRYVRELKPFCEGRSAILREVVQGAFRLIDQGILRLDHKGLQVEPIDEISAESDCTNGRAATKSR